MIPSFEQRHSPGGIACKHFGGGGGSSSSSNTTSNTDKRLAVGDGGYGISGDNSSLTSVNTTTITDSGIVSRALDSIDTSNAIAGQGFTQLLGAADKFFAKGESLIGATQKSVADAYATSRTDGAGTIDNKTIIILAAVAMGGLYAIRGKA